MKLRYTKTDSPHGFLCGTPIHLIYRVHDAAPVGELRRLEQDCINQINLIKSLGRATPELLAELRAEHMQRYDSLLDAQDQSKYLLANEHLAKLVIGSWRTLVELNACRLYAVCVMGNHVHALIAGVEGAKDEPVGNLVRRHKGFLSRSCKEHLNKPDEIWAPGFYDRYVRPGTFWDVLFYVLHNPVKAKLISDWRDWSSLWVDERCIEEARLRGLST